MIELQTRQSCFRQMSTGMAGFGLGMFIPAADIATGSSANMLALCVLGGAAMTSLGIIGLLFTEKLIR